MSHIPMSLEPSEIFIGPRSVHDEQKFLVAGAVDDEIIDNSCSFVKEKRVLTRADRELVDVVGKYEIQPLARAAAFDDELAHVRNVEDADIVPHCLMFLDDAGVLHRHKPASEWNDLRAEPQVLLVKRRLFVAHAAS